MPEVIIEYKKLETLKMIKSLAKYLDFVVADNKERKKEKEDFTVIPGDPAINIDELSQIFTANNCGGITVKERSLV